MFFHKVRTRIKEKVVYFFNYTIRTPVSLMIIMIIVSSIIFFVGIYPDLCVINIIPEDPAAKTGVPVVDKSLGYNELSLYDANAPFEAKFCTALKSTNQSVDVYFTSDAENSELLVLEICNMHGYALGSTGTIKPGQYVQSVNLVRDLEPNEKVKLNIHGYDMETFKHINSVTVNLEKSFSAASDNNQRGFFDYLFKP